MRSSLKEGQEDESKAIKYYNKYAIILKGVVVTKKEVGSGIPDQNYSVYTIKVVNSDVIEHDLREYNEDYYSIVNHDTAKVAIITGQKPATLCL